MNCKEAIDITDNYLNENTEFYNEQEFKQHINECKDCLSAYEDRCFCINLRKTNKKFCEKRRFF